MKYLNAKIFSSFGLSWLSGTFIKNVSAAVSRLESLKASILGLREANCEAIYHNCDIRKQEISRGRRGKKRNFS